MGAWLLSTLFDASLLSTSKPPETAALFLGVCGTSLETIKVLRLNSVLVA